jgi:hypothetical protein
MRLQMPSDLTPYVWGALFGVIIGVSGWQLFFVLVRSIAACR